VHFALYFGNFTLLVLKVILASKLSELEEFKNRAANNQIARKRMKMRLKSNRCYCCQALKQMFLG
jgi:thioredoxin-related protein